MPAAGGAQECLEIYYISLMSLVQISRLKATPLEGLEFRISGTDSPVRLIGKTSV